MQNNCGGIAGQIDIKMGDRLDLRRISGSGNRVGICAHQVMPGRQVITGFNLSIGAAVRQTVQVRQQIGDVVAGSEEVNP